MRIYHNLDILDQNLLKQLFDYFDGNLYWKHDIGAAKKGEKAGYIRKDKGYRSVTIMNKSYYIHRLIFLYHYGKIKNVIDHIDGDKLNNHVENLRDVTLSQNSHNSKKPKNNTSGIKGVCWNKRSKSWIAYCRIENRVNYLGYYKCKDEAARVLMEFREKHHGSFANHG